MENKEVEFMLDDKLEQDFYRAYVCCDSKGNTKIKLNRINIVNICFVKFDGSEKIYAFNNKSNTRIENGNKVIVKTHDKTWKNYSCKEAICVCNVKIHKKYIKDILHLIGSKDKYVKENVYAFYDKNNDLKIINEKYIDEVSDYVKSKM